jgi:hypothetical protein
MQKTDVRWLFLVLAAVVLFSIFGLPYFTQTGHTAWAILVYAFFAVIFLYGRCNHVRKHSTRRQQLR